MIALVLLLLEQLSYITLEKWNFTSWCWTLVLEQLFCISFENIEFHHLFLKITTSIEFIESYKLIGNTWISHLDFESWFWNRCFASASKTSSFTTCFWRSRNPLNSLNPKNWLVTPGMQHCFLCMIRGLLHHHRWQRNGFEGVLVCGVGRIFVNDFNHSSLFCMFLNTQTMRSTSCGAGICGDGFHCGLGLSF